MNKLIKILIFYEIYVYLCYLILKLNLMFLCFLEIIFSVIMFI